MQVFRTDTAAAAETIDLAGQLRVKPTGIAAVWSGLVDFARRKPISAAGGVILVLAVLIAIFAGVIAPHDPQAIGVTDKFAGPGADNALLGTDQLGRDILSKSIFRGMPHAWQGKGQGTFQPSAVAMV